MNIEKVRIVKTLKMGSKYYWEGEEYSSPIPADLRSEVAAGSDAIEVTLGQAPPKKKTVPKRETKLGPKKKLVKRKK